MCFDRDFLVYRELFHIAFFLIKHLFGCCKTLSIFQSFEKVGSNSFCLFSMFFWEYVFWELGAAYSTILLISLPSDISVFSNVTIVLEWFSLYLFSLVLIILLESVLNSFHQVWKILSHYTFKYCFFLIITLFSPAFQLSHILSLFPVPTCLSCSVLVQILQRDRTNKIRIYAERDRK